MKADGWKRNRSLVEMAAGAAGFTAELLVLLLLTRESRRPAQARSLRFLPGLIPLGEEPGLHPCPRDGARSGPPAGAYLSKASCTLRESSPML